MKTILGLVAASALILPTWAATPDATATTNVSNPIILAEGGCGPDFHRNYRGFCVPNYREWDGRACPPGWHLGPERRRCWPN